MRDAAAPSATRIFISYRRAGEEGFVGRLADRLAAVYGEANVFRDVSGLRPGESFEQRIGSTLDAADVVIAVIGSQWLGRRRFRRARIRDREDWVRKEIEHALASGKPVIPILVGNAELPAAAELPPSLRGLAAVHAGRVRDESFHQDTQRMVAEIDAMAAAGGSSGGSAFVWRQVPDGGDAPGRRWIVAAALLATAGAVALLALSRGGGKDEGPATAAGPGGSAGFDPAQPASWRLPPPAASRGPVPHVALQLALLELQTSTRESGGDNAGYNVGKFTARFGAQNLPWSAAFVGWCYLEAARRHADSPQASLAFTDSPNTAAVADSLRARGWLVEPFDAARARPGDVVFLRTGTRLGHMEIVHSVTSEQVCSIGGNVDNRVTGRCRPIAGGMVAALGALPPEAFGSGR